MRLQQQGKITEWNDEKGFGFITPSTGYERVFFHISDIKHRRGRPQINQSVSFICKKDSQGRPCAVEIIYIGKHLRKQPANPNPHAGKKKIMPYVLVFLFFATVAILTFVFAIIPIFVIAIYAVASLVTFIAYAIDKSAAQHGRWRTSESTLHSMSLLGGWPGALIAQQTLHHKSIKKEFQWEYKFTVLLNVAVTVWLLTPRGPELTLTFLDFLEKVFK